MAERSRARTRAKRRGRAWGLFILGASLLSLLVYALAETVNRGMLVPTTVATATPLLVPARIVADGHDWLENGLLTVDGAGAPVPSGWQRVEAAARQSELMRQDSYESFTCVEGPCISGLMQVRPDLAAGHYTLEADVYLGGPYTGLAARLGFDPEGGEDPTSASVLWSEPGGKYDWQRLTLEVDHDGGAATVYALFDVLAPEGEGRLAGLLLLGATAPPTPVATMGAVPQTPTPAPANEERVLLVGADDLQWQDEAELQTVVERARDGGFTTIYLQVRRLGYAYYDSAAEPAAPAIAEGGRARWDPLARAVDLAHGAGLRLYAWVDVLPTWQGVEPPTASVPGHMYDLFNSRYGSDWLQATTPTDPPVYYASPAQEQVRTYLASVARDLTSRYEVDGLFLTGVRYEAGAGAAQVQETAEGTPVTVEVTPAVAEGTPVTAEGTAAAAVVDDGEWRRAQLTALLQSVVDGARAGREGVAISVAVAPVDDTGSACQRCEDGRGWAAAGLADVVVPRLDEGDAYARPQALQDAASTWATGVRGAIVVPAISAEVRSFVSVSRSVESLRAAGAAGVVVAGYGSLDERGYWDDLARGVFATPATSVVGGVVP